MSTMEAQAPVVAADELADPASHVLMNVSSMSRIRSGDA